MSSGKTGISTRKAGREVMVRVVEMDPERESEDDRVGGRFAESEAGERRIASRLGVGQGSPGGVKISLFRWTCLGLDIIFPLWFILRCL